jgi:hypothetical protein
MMLQMTVIDAQRGNTRERTIEVLRRRTPSGYRTRFTTIAPESLRGVAVLLVEEEPASKIWLYFPAGKEKTEMTTRGLSALGSDFSCEDLRVHFPLGDYEFVNLGRAMVDGHASWKIEMKPRTAALKRTIGFARAIGWVRGDAWMIVRAEFFDSHDQRLKTFQSDLPVRVGGIWTSRRYSMISARVRHRTDVIVTEIDYDAAIDPRMVDPDWLGR